MKIKKVRSISFKLTLWYIAILTIILILAGVFLYQGFRVNLVNEMDETILEIANEVYDSWKWHRGVTWEEAILETKEEFKVHRPFIQVVKFDDDEKEVMGVIQAGEKRGEPLVLDTRTYCKAERADIDELVYLKVKEKKLSAYPLRLVLLPGKDPYIVQVGISFEETAMALRRLMIIMVFAGLLILGLASAGGNFIIRKALKPVQKTVSTAKEITADDLSLRIDSENRGDEIGALVNTFNEMIARLEKSVKKIKQFSGDVSHELRTPLTNIRGEIEVILRKDRKKEKYQNTLKSVLEETYKIEKIIDDLLFLSRVESAEKIKFKKGVLLDEIVLRVVESQEQSSKEQNVELVIKKLKSYPIKGNESLLERLVSNLLSNAVKYTPSGGKVEINMEKKDSSLLFSVMDTGVGIPQESLPYIFDRFYVVDKSRSRETGGTGLGLSIVKTVADIHGASVNVQSQKGQGTAFQVRFPLS
ncbi:HAMP domain-containing protein [bacterium]|nr:HAMP domain-containing protein [bacterium]